MKILLLLLVTISTFVVFYLYGYRINLTSSIPTGIYKINKSAKFHKGSLVVFCLTNKEAKYAKIKEYLGLGVLCPSFTIPLAKYIIAEAGDEISILDEIIVNHKIIKNTQVKKVDSLGRQIKRKHYFNKILHDDEFILSASHHPSSYDSRYFGIIKRDQIIGSIEAILLFD